MVVSRGYLVFVPDIHYTVGKTGENVYNSVVSAARFLAKKPWVESSKMGIGGQSFGGYETNYLITHSNLFAAAASSAGITNLAANYGIVRGWVNQGASGQIDYESGQMRLGTTLWQNPDIYLKNSPLFNIDKVTTPVLIRHNINDPQVPCTESIELFNGLRRLKKKAWMLQYDNSGHGNHGIKDKVDLTIRITQFFDHYLKSMPPPRWMTQGIPANLKGIELRYELDPAGSCGDDCKICQKKDYQHVEILDVMNPNIIKYKVDANMQVTKY